MMKHKSQDMYFHMLMEIETHCPFHESQATGLHMPITYIIPLPEIEKPPISQ